MDCYVLHSGSWPVLARRWDYNKERRKSDAAKNKNFLFAHGSKALEEKKRVRHSHLTMDLEVLEAEFISRAVPAHHLQLRVDLLIQGLFLGVELQVDLVLLVDGDLEGVDQFDISTVLFAEEGAEYCRKKEFFFNKKTDCLGSARNTVLLNTKGVVLNLVCVCTF